MNLSGRELEWLTNVAQRSETALEKSRVFLGLGTEEYYKDPLTMLQLGMAVAMDKPVFMLVPEGTKVPDNIRRLARGIEYYTKDNLQEKTTAIIKMAGLLDESGGTK